MVDITAGAGEKVLGVNTSCLLTSGKSSRVFMVGGRGYHDLACEAMVPAKLAWRGYVSGCELLASLDDSGTVLIATLVGKYHELMTVFADGAPERRRVEAVFASLKVNDTPQGLTLTPLNDTFTTIAWEDVSVIVDERGSLTVPGPTGAHGILPKWQGSKTSKGELWKRPLEGASGRAIGDFSYILGCPRGAAEVSISPRTSATEADLLAWLDTLSVAWR
jgi:hypothetical protein